MNPGICYSIICKDAKQSTSCTLLLKFFFPRVDTCPQISNTFRNREIYYLKHKSPEKKVQVICYFCSQELNSEKEDNKLLVMNHMTLRRVKWKKKMNYMDVSYPQFVKIKDFSKFSVPFDMKLSLGSSFLITNP